MSSLQRLVNLLQWHLMNEFAHRSQWVRYNDTKSACVVFFDSLHLRNQHQWRWIYYIQRYESNDMKRRAEKHQFNRFATRSNQFVFFAALCLSSMRQYSTSISAVNQNAPINKNSKSSNSRSLKQHTSAKSISLCCFCFCFAREIDRFFILICRYLSHQFDKILNKIFNKILISIALAYIFCFRTSSSVFVFTSLRLSHLLWDFQLQSWSVTHLRFSQWTSSQCRSIRRNEIVASKRNLKKRRE